MSYTGKDLSATAQHLKFTGVQTKCRESESFCYQMQSDLNLINLQWKYGIR